MQWRMRLLQKKKKNQKKIVDCRDVYFYMRRLFFSFPTSASEEAETYIFRNGAKTRKGEWSQAARDTSVAAT